ncbi:hypothetical protein B0J13DRAFT_465653 [Dactylonectria estremocensis]|uniref:Nephrocystin 3-like N-terminal domain-containing protein n=1 Tax=Dactylonectria estremocensis TaxID=1079267 RepID=A0A9P9JAK7_9HYPO|nr:hypothetical protein B0J13DRAFT_465653 [Dactylonectria estremocensis]
MNGLRKTFNIRRKRRNSNSSSLVSDVPDDASSSREAMETIQKGHVEPLPGLTNGKVTRHETVSVNVKELSDVESETKTTVASESSHTSREIHNSRDVHNLEQVQSPRQTPVDALTVPTRYVQPLDDFVRVRDVTRKVLDDICRLPAYSPVFVKEMNLRSYLQFISNERLIHMPPRGSEWDRVLSLAQFFGLQLWFFGTKIETFAPGSKSTAGAALAACQVLLENGHGQARALVPTFTALYELAMLLSNIDHIRDLVQMPLHIRKNSANIFCDLVELVNSIAVYYHQRVSHLAPGETTTISFDAVFGRQIDDVWQSKNALCENVWIHRLGDREADKGLRWLCEKLQPSFGPSVRNTLYDEVLEQLDRSEDTCTWFKEHLVQFFDSKERVLSVNGPSGVGKTVLTEWVQERLARPLDHKSYAVLTYNFPHDSVKEATSLACVKSFLFQLLERSVGDIDLYNALAQAFTSHAKSHDAAKLESALWTTLHSALRERERGDASVVLLADGCDDTSGASEAAVAFHTKLRDAVAKLSRARVITFSRPVSGAKGKVLAIDGDSVHEDIKVHLRQTLSGSSHWEELAFDVAEQLLDDLVAKANGSFLWAFYAGRLLVTETSCDGFQAAARSISPEVHDVLREVVGKLRLKDNEVLQHLLSFMLVTAEPFTVVEAAELLSTDLHRHAMASSAIRISKMVSTQCGDLVVIRGGRLHFRSSVVRSYMRTLLGKTLLSTSDAHLQLTLRMLLYARLNLDVDQELVTEELPDAAVDAVLGSHRFLGYVMRNWAFHFRLSGLVDAKGKVQLAQGFKEIFPSSLMFGLLERSCWRRHHAGQDMLDLHELALKVRETCFGKEHVTVLQTLITLGHVHVSISDSPVCGAGYFYRAIKLGQTILSSTSTVVAACTTLFLTWTETIVITKRTEIITCREEVIRIMIQICKHRHGPSSDEVIHWLEVLLKFYIDIKEEHHATVCYRELHEIIIIRFGKGSPRARDMGTFFGGLDVVLQGETAVRDIGELEDLIFETTDELEFTDGLCIRMLIRLARSYVVCGKFYLAERLYLSLWRRICVICRVNSSIEIHVSKITIALAYVSFLREVRRIEEATTVLICLWAEYEHHVCEVHELIILIREIGTVCRSFGLLSITISILIKVHGWFKDHGREDDDDAQETTVIITEVVEEITETTITEKTTTTTTTEVTETVVKEIFERHFTRCKGGHVDHAFFSSCMALIAIYIKNADWTQAEVIITRTLEITWKAVLTADVNITLCEHYVKECVLVAGRLAHCHRRRGFFEQAEQIYLRIYYACLASCGLEDEALDEAICVLVEFYEEHHRHEKVIEIYVEILGRYRKHLGRSHRLTIKMLYKLGGHCHMLGRKDACEHYLEIVTVLNKGLKHCHHDAFEAAMFLCRHYHHRKLWIDLREICTVLWTTVVHHRDHCHLTEEVIIELYEKYIYVLEVHAKVEFSVLYEICIQYKEVVTVVCGGDSLAYILVLVALAGMCEKHEDHHHESVDIYEEVITRTKTTKTTTTTVVERTVHTVKKRLSKLYVQIITKGKAGSGRKIPFDRAIEICIETYERLKIELGCWHESTLLVLRDIIILYQKIGTKEAHVRIIQLLEISVTEIITTLKVTVNLFTAAITLASIYVHAGLAKEGHELLRQFRHLVVFRGDMPCSDIRLKLDKHVSKVVFVFLIAFEQVLYGEECVTSYTEIMATIIFESVLYEEYVRVITCEESIEVVMECGAKLRCFWEETSRHHLIATLDAKLFGLFKSKYGVHWKSANDKHVHIFYVAILLELNKDRGATKLDFAALACKAGNDRVRELLEEKDFNAADQVAHCVFRFAREQHVYHRRSCIQLGYKLAEFMAGIDVPHPRDPKDNDLHKHMLDTSREIMAVVLDAFRAAQIDVASLRFHDVAGLIRLLGAQGSFGELEHLLDSLWRSREIVQKTRGWSPAIVLNIGKLLVHAQYAHGHVRKAIATAELLSYNLRRGRSRLDLETLEVSRLLASLYASSKRPSNAMAVHEAVLREISSACARPDDESNGAYPDRTRLTGEARLHLELLRAASHQMQGKWTKSVGEIGDLYGRLKTGLRLEVPAFDQWASSSDKSLDGKYLAPRDWKLEGEVSESVVFKGDVCREPVSGGFDVVHAASEWWLVY